MTPLSAVIEYFYEYARSAATGLIYKYSEHNVYDYVISLVLYDVVFV